MVVGGNVITRECIHFYEDLPETFEYTFLTGDTAQKTKEHNDWTVFVFWGVTKNKIYFIDMMRDKLKAPDLKKRAISFFGKWNNYRESFTREFCIEDKVSGTGLIQSLEQETMIPVTPIQKNTDKLTDVEDCTPAMEAGKVLLPYNENYGQNKYVISELISFSRDDSHTWDDVVDNFTMAIKRTLVGSPGTLDVL